MTEMTLAERLTVIAEHAPKLRVAGVQSLTIDGIALVLAPPDDPAPLKDEESELVDPANDPLTYGRTGKVPGFDRPSDLPERGKR